ncbi:MAG: tetratricopeptide repeat protein [Bacteroidetes bacterium]|nr:tetratricopeptide repeat protein [Bacteroidota bacterium]
MPTVTDTRTLARWERQLEQMEDDRQRLFLLDQLVSHYAYTDTNRAEKGLEEYHQILEREDLPDFRLSFHRLKAFVENQLYRFEKAGLHIRQALKLVQERGDVQQQASVLIECAGIEMNLHNLDESAELLEKATRLLKAFPDTSLEARLLCRRGYMHLHVGDYSQAIELFMEAGKKLRRNQTSFSLSDYYFECLIYSGTGKVFEQNNEWEKSAEAYEKVVSVCEKLGMRTRLSWHYLNAGNAYLALDDEEKAESFFKKAIDAPDDSSPLARASAYANLGYLRFQSGQFEDAKVLYDRAEQGYKEWRSDDYYNFANIDRWRAHLYLELDEVDQAIEYFVSAFNYAEAIEDYKQISGIYKDMATFYASEGDFKNAYEYQVLYDEYAEKYAEQVNARKLLELEVKYEAGQKKQEAELLRLQATQLQLKALRAQMNPHFMFNALNAIQHYITSNEVKYASKYLAKFAKLMRKALEYSNLELISLEEEIEFLRDYLSINEKLRFENRLSFEIQVDDQIEEDIMGVPTMIIQPYVENAIEHGIRSIGKGKILISFSLLEDENILCVVEDNGIGRERSRQLQEQDQEFVNHRSLGTSITEKRLQLLHQSKADALFVETIDLKDPETGKAAGTRVEISIPVVEVKLK